MRSIIDGKIYDTEQAEQLARHYHQEFRVESGYLRETLYKANDGMYLIHLQKAGPALDRYVARADEMPIEEERLQRIPPEDVIEWCEENDVANDVILEEFDDLIEEP